MSSLFNTLATNVINGNDIIKINDKNIKVVLVKICDVEGGESMEVCGITSLNYVTQLQVECGGEISFDHDMVYGVLNPVTETVTGWDFDHSGYSLYAIGSTGEFKQFRTSGKYAPKDNGLSNIIAKIEEIKASIDDDKASFTTNRSIGSKSPAVAA